MEKFQCIPQSFIERLQYYMEISGINDNQMTINAGLSVGLIGKAKSTGKGMSSMNIEKILLSYPNLSADWLLTGRGEMLTTPTIPTAPTAISTDPAVGTPYYDVDFLGGFSEIFNNQTLIPACNVIVPGFEKASLWCNVTGHSMEPKINHGDIIALHECTINDIQYGEIYAVVLDTIRTIKILRKGSQPDKLLYVPINKPDYEEQEFDISRIIKVFEVVGSISKFF